MTSPESDAFSEKFLEPAGGAGLPGLTPEGARRDLTDQERALIPGYEMLQFLGGGGMGAVYKARQIGLDRVVALKLLRPDVAADPETVQRFLVEARTAGKLRHENIVGGLDCGVVQGFRYLILEFVEGESLDAVLRRRGRLPEREALEIVRQVASGLQYAWSHRVVHRDIKAQNIMMTPEGTAKICDLGLCRDTRSRVHLTVTGYVNCTPTHASPEQARGDKELDCRTDIYSLGVTLYHMTTGVLPFQGASLGDLLIKQATESPVPPNQRDPGLSAGVSALILRMLEKDRDRRPATPGDLVALIQELLRPPQGSPTPVRPKPAPTRRTEPPPPPLRRRPPLLAVAALALAVVAALGFLLPTRGKAGAPEPAPRPAAAPSEPSASARGLAALEKLAAAGATPEALLVECDAARKTIRGTPEEPRFKEIEAGAVAAQRKTDATKQVDAALREARKIMAQDPSASRYLELDAMLKAAAAIAGPRAGEVEALRKECADRRARALASSPPAVAPAPGPGFMPPRTGAGVAVFKDKLWVVGGTEVKKVEGKARHYGDLSDVWCSSNGTDWTSLVSRGPFGGRSQAALVAFRDKIWFLAGHLYVPGKNSIWSSMDGANWIRETENAPFPPRGMPSCVVFKDRLWLLGGYHAGKKEFSDVWSSADGIDWKLEVENPGFIFGHSCSAIAFKDRIWVFGGPSIRSSADGVRWELAKRQAAYPHRTKPLMTEAWDRLWLVGGWSGKAMMNDVWSSQDGVDWVRETEKSAFPGWPGAALAFFRGQLWTVHGLDPEARGEIWSSADGRAFIDRTKR